MSRYDALVLVSFGGPEGPDDVLPFLENVVRGRGVPRERLLAVAEHYQHFGGVSPINAQNRALLAALREQIDLPVYWGNRNWAPYLTDTVAEMTALRLCDPVTGPLDQTTERRPAAGRGSDVATYDAGQANPRAATERLLAPADLPPGTQASG